MRTVIAAALSSLTLSTVLCLSAVAQSSGEQNPNQPNGYRASEASSHYHGNYEMPAYQQNGYRASEARSHYGGAKYEPAGGWSYQNNTGPGSAFSSQSVGSGGPGSAYSNASWYQNGGPQNSFAERMQRSARWQNAFRNLSSAGYFPGCTSRGTAYGANPNQQSIFSNFRSRLSTFEPMIQREQSLRESAIRNIETGQGGFNQIYAH